MAAHVEAAQAVIYVTVGVWFMCDTANKVAVVLVVVAEEEEGDIGVVKLKKTKTPTLSLPESAKCQRPIWANTTDVEISAPHSMCTSHTTLKYSNRSMRFETGYFNFQMASHASLRKEHLDGN